MTFAPIDFKTDLEVVDLEIFGTLRVAGTCAKRHAVSHTVVYSECKTAVFTFTGPLPTRLKAKAHIK